MLVFAISGTQIEQLVDELILFANIIAADPARLPFPNHMDRLLSLNRSPRRLKFAKPLLRFHPSFDRSMVLLQDVVQVLDLSVPTAAAECPFHLEVWDGRAVDRCLIRVDGTRL